MFFALIIFKSLRFAEAGRFLRRAWVQRCLQVSALSSNLRRIANSFRAYSTEVRQQESIVIYVDRKNFRSKWQKLFAQDKKYPFPGSVTSKLAYVNEQKKTELDFRKATLEEVLNKRANPVKRETLGEKDSGKGLVELKAMECPKLFRKDLQDLFKGVKLNNAVSVLNLTQKTEHDMSIWSMDMEVERLQLTAGFIEAALRICELLRRDGYWADFIDPSSGRPYLGRYTNATLCDTDDRYRSLGFRVTDLGCCKVLEHGSWGTNAFVGTIFTDAPIHSPILAKILSTEKE